MYVPIFADIVFEFAFRFEISLAVASTYIIK